MELPIPYNNPLTGVILHSGDVNITLTTGTNENWHLVQT